MSRVGRDIEPLFNLIWPNGLTQSLMWCDVAYTKWKLYFNIQACNIKMHIHETIFVKAMHVKQMDDIQQSVNNLFEKLELTNKIKKMPL